MIPKYKSLQALEKNDPCVEYSARSFLASCAAVRYLPMIQERIIAIDLFVFVNSGNIFTFKYDVLSSILMRQDTP
jgi:hypothetical protein